LRESGPCHLRSAADFNGGRIEIGVDLKKNPEADHSTSGV